MAKPWIGRRSHDRASIRAIRGIRVIRGKETSFSSLHRFSRDLSIASQLNGLV
jgi:hypothetical protein